MKSSSHLPVVPVVMVSLILFPILLLQGCASQQSRFDQINPGMTGSEARAAMHAGPTHFENVPNSEYATWYWGKDYCVLLKSDKVIAKDSAEAGRTVNVGPGKYEEKKQAQCLAPGQAAQNGVGRTINIPGVGSIELPRGQLANPPTTAPGG